MSKEEEVAFFSLSLYTQPIWSLFLAATFRSVIGFLLSVKDAAALVANVLSATLNIEPRTVVCLDERGRSIVQNCQT